MRKLFFVLFVFVLGISTRLLVLYGLSHRILRGPDPGTAEKCVA